MLQKLALIFIPLIALIIGIFFYFGMQVKEQKIYNIMDQLRLTLDAQLKEHKMNDLKTAILLSKNQALIDALENEDEDLGYILLSNTIKEIEKNTHYHIRAQIITDELNIFARSWDDVYAGMPIGDYRTDLKYFQTHTTPRTSMEIGRRLGVKATVPVYLKDGTRLGFMEVISFFKGLTNFFSTMGVDLYVLLDTKYMDTAVLMTDNLAMQNYIVANRNYNYSHIQTLKKVDFKELRLSGVTHRDDKYIFYENMKDGDGKIIGGFVFVLPQRYFDYFRDPEDDISFLVNVTRSSLYDITKAESYSGEMYTNLSADSMMSLQEIIEREDRELFLDEAYDKLDSYSKDELIQMMLNKNIVKKIDGKIK
ncbi:MAG: hypothetical protein JXQ67_06645 [Campylobacterales bacterium]|nr:hypothetical protein [Campylobacterales bacterium]